MNNLVLVIATKKNFWGSKESNIFPHQIHTWVLWGYSEDRFNTLILVVRSWFLIWLKKPKLIIVGQAARAAVWLSYLIRFRLLPKSKWIAIDPVYLHNRHSRYYDRVLVYVSEQIPPVNSDRYRFIPLPANGDFTGIQTLRKPYFSCVGRSFRDFRSIILAAKKTGLPLIIATPSKEFLGDIQEVPPNVTVCYETWKDLQKCLKLVAESRAVIIPLFEGKFPVGQSAAVQALRLGKAIISTKNATLDDYIQSGNEGILVQAKDVNAYADAMIKLWKDDVFIEKAEIYAKQKSIQFSFSFFAESLVKNCKEVLSETHLIETSTR
jgi:glycosyltransferase involved in cell wall biosynthesis